MTMKWMVYVLLLSLSFVAYAADIIEERLDGSKTVWHDDGKRVDYDATGHKV